MSGIEGLDRVKAKLAALDRHAGVRLDEAVETGARQMQADMVALVPKRTGRLVSLLSMTETVRVRRVGGRVQAEVGFLTRQQQRQGYYAWWVETGTKGYTPGETRRAGRDKKGKRRVKRIKRTIPARPAQPFYRPALANLQRNLVRLRKEAWARAAGDALTRG